jgi:hypothetical protein
MNKLILSGAIGAAALLVSACGNNDTQPAAEDTTAAAADAATAAATIAPTAATAASDWPSGTRIVEQGGVTYRVDPAGTRVAIDDNSWHIVTDKGARYRVDPTGNRIRIDDEGLDLHGAASGPDIPGVDVDVGTNNKGHLDVDVSTNGTDASNDRENDR